MRKLVWLLLVTLLLSGCSFSESFSEYQMFIHEQVEQLKEGLKSLTQIGGIEIEYNN